MLVEKLSERSLLTIKYVVHIMRGDDQQQSNVFSYVSLEERVPADHPLRPIRKTVDRVLKAMSREFDKLYAEGILVRDPQLP